MITPKAPKNLGKRYFTKDTENAIIQYNKCEDGLEKDIIYKKNIHYSFFKLTQNIIHSFKFHHTDVEDLTHLQHRIEVFLLSKLHLYDHKKNLNDKFYKIIVKEFGEEYIEDSFLEYVGEVDRVPQKQINSFIEIISKENNLSKKCIEKLKKLTPPKAYSYFGTIVKRWLIKYNQDCYNKKINTSDLEDLSKDENHSYSLDSKSPTLDSLSDFIDEYVNYITENIFILFPKKNDAKIADAILDLFRKRDYIEIFNKKALYSNIREFLERDGVKVKTPKITQISTKLKNIFEEEYKFFIETGIIRFRSY